jgi:5-methylcytosine-specific restriction endonuclease McrA
VTATLRCLILNADCRPISTHPLHFMSAQDAIKAVYQDKAIVVEEWDAVFRSATQQIRVPKVLMLRQFAPVASTPKFCRASVFLRDRYSCQYCGHQFPKSELTYDHLIPRSKGGKTEWDNILTACVACNARKKNAMPDYSGQKGKRGHSGDTMRPLKLPRQPSTAEMLRAGLEFLEPEVKEDFASWLYWNTPLEA